MQRPPIVILGAGLSGLLAAYPSLNMDHSILGGRAAAQATLEGTTDE